MPGDLYKPFIKTSDVGAFQISFQFISVHPRTWICYYVLSGNSFLPNGTWKLTGSFLCIHDNKVVGIFSFKYCRMTFCNMWHFTLIGRPENFLPQIIIFIQASSSLLSLNTAINHNTKNSFEVFPVVILKFLQVYWDFVRNWIASVIHLPCEKRFS